MVRGQESTSLLARRSALVKPAALTDWAYETIKEDVLNLRHPPGGQLRVETLADQMGISRTPVREALLRLQSEGLLRSVARVGFFVTEISRVDLQELFELRILLESYIADKAATYLTDADLKRLDDLVKDQNMVVTKTGDLATFLKMDVELHDLLLERAGNKRLIRMMETVQDLTFRERALSIRSAQNISETLKEHQRLVEGLHRRDGQLASRLMREHLSAVRDRILRLVDSTDKTTQSETSSTRRG